MQLDKIKQNCVFVSSGGRTGTRFFTTMLNNNFEKIISFQEPENFRLYDLKELNVVRKHFGLIRPSILKMLGLWGITNLSNQRLGNKTTLETASQKLYNQRAKFIDNFSNYDVFVETSFHYYGLLDVIDNVFENYRYIYIIRDPRDWVRSQINLKKWYYPLNPNTIFNNRISPMKVNDTQYSKKWKNMDIFEKLCWAWNYINSRVYETIGQYKNAKLVLFEDLFKNKGKVEKMKELLDFMFSFSNLSVSTDIGFEEIMSKKINKPKDYFFPKWENWSRERAGILDHHCGKLMNLLEYGHEEDWKSLIKLNQGN